jgi:hypothetical protein
VELELTGWRRKLVRLGALSGVDQGASRAISDRHFSVQLNHCLYYLIVAVFLKWQSDITPGASTHGEVEPLHAFLFEDLLLLAAPAGLDEGNCHSASLILVCM